MLSDEIRLRLELLNRQALPIAGDTPAGGYAPRRFATAEYQTVEPTESDRWSAGEVRYLDNGCEIENQAGRHLAITQPLSRFLHEVDTLVERVDRACATVNQATNQARPDLAALATAFPKEVLFLDLETCGLGGAMIFLVGLLHVTEKGIALHQLLARNYAEERAILTTFWQIASRNNVLVTFNGKSFDWPLVHDRSTLHRLGRRCFDADRGPVGTAEILQPHDIRPELVHFDVLHHARRRWRHRLPNCRLQTLERYLCRRMRQDDVPGSQIPAAYHEFVRSGETRLIESILHHNALDLVTMTQVAMRILVESALEAQPDELQSPRMSA